jgi:predicted ATPase
MELAQQLGDPALLLQAHHASWPVVAQFFPDEMLVAVAHIEAGLALYDPTQHRRMMLEYGGHDPSICAHQAASKLFWLLGYPEKGLGHGIQAIETAKEIGYPFGIAVALNNVSAMYIYRREFAVAAALAAESAVICEQQHFSLILAETQIFHGMAVAMQGELAVGLEELQQGIADWTALGTTLGIPLHQILLADVYLAAGEPHAALAAADQAIAASAIEGYLEAEAHRLRGAALLAVGAAEAQAEAAFERAIAIAQRQSARSLELRAAVSLAQLWRQQGNAAEARRLLEPIYSWFTEGFDTVDLRAARALLDALM